MRQAQRGDRIEENTAMANRHHAEACQVQIAAGGKRLSMYSSASDAGALRVATTDSQ
jgi:hypothetical protein